MAVFEMGDTRLEPVIPSLSSWCSRHDTRRRLPCNPCKRPRSGVGYTVPSASLHDGVLGRLRREPSRATLGSYEVIGRLSLATACGTGNSRTGSKVQSTGGSTRKRLRGAGGLFKLARIAGPGRYGLCVPERPAARWRKLRSWAPRRLKGTDSWALETPPCERAPELRDGLEWLRNADKPNR